MVRYHGFIDAAFEGRRFLRALLIISLPPSNIEAGLQNLSKIFCSLCTCLSVPWPPFLSVSDLVLLRMTSVDSLVALAGWLASRSKGCMAGDLYCPPWTTPRSSTGMVAGTSLWPHRPAPGTSLGSCGTWADCTIVGTLYWPPRPAPRSSRDSWCPSACWAAWCYSGCPLWATPGSLTSRCWSLQGVH